MLCSSVTVSGIGQASEALRKRSLLPSPTAEQLGDMARDFHKQTGLVLCPDGHGIDQQGRLVQRLAFAETHWLDASGRFGPQVPLDKAREVISALNRRPLPGLLEWHKGPMPFGSAPVHLAQRVGNMSGPGGAMGQEVLAVRTREGLRCLSGMHRPLDPERMRRVGLRRTGDIVADRMLDVAAAEIEAGNAGANELGIIGDILKGLFDDGATKIQRISSGGTGMPIPGQSIQNIKDAFVALGFSPLGPGDLLNGAAFLLTDLAYLGSIKEEAYDMTRKTMGRNGHNDASDAFRHAYLSFRLAQEFGPSSAKRIGDGHERRPFGHYTGYSLSGPNSPVGEVIMDLYNNHMGRELFLSNNGQKLAQNEIAAIIKRAITGGKLQTTPFVIKNR